MNSRAKGWNYGTNLSRWPNTLLECWYRCSLAPLRPSSHWRQPHTMLKGKTRSEWGRRNAQPRWKAGSPPPLFIEIFDRNSNRSRQNLCKLMESLQSFWRVHQKQNIPSILTGSVKICIVTLIFTESSVKMQHALSKFTSRYMFTMFSSKWFPFYHTFWRIKCLSKFFLKIRL